MKHIQFTNDWPLLPLYGIKRFHFTGNHVHIGSIVICCYLIWRVFRSILWYRHNMLQNMGLCSFCLCGLISLIAFVVCINKRKKLIWRIHSTATFNCIMFIMNFIHKHSNNRAKNTFLWRSNGWLIDLI